MVTITRKFIVGLFILTVIVLILVRAFIIDFPPIEKPETENNSDDVPDYAYNYTYKVIQSYTHDHTAFTQGLVIEDSMLYEGTGRYGSSTLRKIDLETGTILKSRNLDSKYFGEGITILENRVFQLTWKSNVGFVYDLDTFDIMEQFSYPTEGWGITHDSERLIMSDGSATLYFLDPETFERVGSINVTENGTKINLLNELEFINGEIYANIWYSDSIVRINPETGNVTGRIDLTGLINPDDYDHAVNVLNGIAYDNEKSKLYVTGKYWPELFEIKMVPLA
jgi:glutamine cyclotransferase